MSAKELLAMTLADAAAAIRSKKVSPVELTEAALAGKKSAKEALDSAVSRGNQALHQFERTVSR